MQEEERKELFNAKIPCEASGIHVERGICGFCGGKCLLDLYVKDGKIIKTEGCSSMAGPNHGTVCVKGAALKQALYHPDRLLYPMKRTGVRGEGSFERITWEEAYRTIAERMGEAKENYGARSALVYAGHPKWFRPQLTRLCNVYGTPNFGTESSTCNYARVMAFETCLGTGGRGAGADMKNCRTLLLWGVNQMYSRSNTWSKEYLKLIARGANVIAVDPRCTPTTEQASLHLRPIPGTDGALALGMARVLITEDLYDKEYVEQYCYGFNEYRDYVMKFTPEHVERITGVPAEQMCRAARMLAAEKPVSLTMTSSPMVHHINGVQNTRAIVLLMVLTGNYGITGGLGAPGKGKAKLKENFHGTMLKREDAENDLSSREFPAWAKLNYHEAQVTRIADYIEGKGDYPIHTLLAFGMNHHMWPDPAHIERAFERLDFFVNVDLYMTETCRFADIILPAAMAPEREQIELLGGNRVYYQPKVVKTAGEAKNDMEIILGLADAMGLSIGEPALKNFDDYMEMSLKPTGITLDELKASPEGLLYRGSIKEKTTEDILGNIQTPTGKLEFVSSVLEACGKDGHDGLPVYRDFRELLPMREYPLILSTGCRKPQLFHKRTYRLPWLARLEKTPVIEVHPDTVRAYDMRAGEVVILETPKGSMEMELCTDTSCLPGIVHVYHGAEGKDINQLLDETYYDPISGFPGFKSYCCRLLKKKQSVK